jgi:hypothetical protein
MFEEKPSTYTVGDILLLSALTYHALPRFITNLSLCLGPGILLGSTASNIAGSSRNRVLHPISNKAYLIGLHNVTYRRVTRLDVT